MDVPQNTEDTDPLDESVEALNLSARSLNCLQALGIEQIRDLVHRHPRELLRIPNFGATSLEDVRTRLKTRGLELGLYSGPPESMPIEFFDMPRVIQPSLERLGIATVGSLAGISHETLWKIQGLGDLKREVLLEHILRARKFVNSEASTVRDETSHLALDTRIPPVAPVSEADRFTDKMVEQYGMEFFKDWSEEEQDTYAKLRIREE